MNARQRSIGNRVAPARFVLFCAIAAVAIPVAIEWTDASTGVMIGFDVAAAVFLAACAPLLRQASAGAMRDAALRNDANRTMLLVIAGVASVAVLAAVASELSAAGRPAAGIMALIVTTLALAWTFGNTVYALHYAHLFYLPGEGGGDAGGLDVPGTGEPGYWDFVYFAFTLGMTFQTSDIAVTTPRMRKPAIAHSIAAFVFNLGIVAFTINVLGG